MNTHTKLLTPKQVALRYALHPHTVSRYLCGAIEMNLPAAFKVGGQWRFREDDVDAHIDKLSGRVQPNAADEVGSAPMLSTPAASKRAGRPRKVAGCTLRGAV